MDSDTIHMGPTGPTGAPGIAAFTGATGPTGYHGHTGPTGPPGRDGLTGNDGLPGRDGPTGPMGLQGIPGRDGVTGPVGPRGEPGIPGLIGPTGPTGEMPQPLGISDDPHFRSIRLNGTVIGPDGMSYEGDMVLSLCGKESMRISSGDGTTLRVLDGNLAIMADTVNLRGRVSVETVESISIRQPVEADSMIVVGTCGRLMLKPVNEVNAVRSRESDDRTAAILAPTDGRLDLVIRGGAGDTNAVYLPAEADPSVGRERYLEAWNRNLTPSLRSHGSPWLLDVGDPAKALMLDGSSITAMRIDGSAAVLDLAADGGVMANGAEIGLRDRRQTAVSSTHTLSAADRGGHVFCSGGSARVVIPRDGESGMAIGSEFVIITDPCTSATLEWGAATTVVSVVPAAKPGSILIPPGHRVTVLKLGDDLWHAA